jgi:hypothetical protein
MELKVRFQKCMNPITDSIINTTDIVMKRIMFGRGKKIAVIRKTTPTHIPRVCNV